MGERPGALRDELADQETGAGINMDRGKGAGKSTATGAPALPDLALGLPSEVARRRPDIRAAEARLHRATANIGVAQADLYPSIRLGAHVGLESYLSGEFSDWGSRAWSIGPSLSLPLFDHGRRKSVVELRKLEQQEAAVDFQRTVLKAWQEIDDALNAYTAERQQARQLAERARSAGDACKLALARYEGGAVDYTVALDSQRRYLQARRDLAASEGRLATRYVTVNKAIGNVPRDEPSAARRRRVAGVRPALVCCPAQAKRPSSASAVTTMQYSPSRLASDMACTSSAPRGAPFQSLRPKVKQPSATSQV